MLALYIAFWAGLDDPTWSFLTVYIVSQPDSGLVLAKGFYRILGTMAGVIVSIALVGATWIPNRAKRASMRREDIHIAVA